ncbi:MAG TPA: MFS transporter [Candidatus Binatia bacterium]|nr:MFS transporter [Candidatus Binatia bacterium]
MAMTIDSGNKGAPAETAGKFSIFKLRNFRYFWIGTIFSNIGEHIENVIRNWLIWELTHSVFWLMVMVFMHWIPFALLSLPAGSLSERVNRQRLIIWTEVGQCAAALGMFAATYLGVMDQYWMSALLILHSVSGALSNPCRQLFLHDMVGREYLLSGIALTSSIRFATQSVGKPIGGVILLTLGASFGFLANAVAYLPIMLALLTVIRVAQNEAPRVRRPLEEFKEGVRHVTAERSTLATLCVAIAPSVFVGNGFDPFLVIYADTVFGMGATGYTYFITAVGVGAIVAVAILGALGNVVWKGKMLFGGIFGFCISMALFSLSRSFVTSLIFLFLFGFFQVIHNTASTVMLLENVPNEMRGRVMGIFNFGRLGLRVMNGPFFALLNKLALLGAAGAFATNAITVTAAAATVAVLTFTLALLAPGLSKQR